MAMDCEKNEQNPVPKRIFMTGKMEKPGCLALPKDAGK
jgi:hypothetical protein